MPIPIDLLCGYKHADIIEIERQSDKFLNTARSVLQTKEIEAQIEAGGVLYAPHSHGQPRPQVVSRFDQRLVYAGESKTLEEGLKV